MFKKSYCWDDVLLIPRYSDLSSRSEVSLGVKLNKNFSFETPFIPANMKTVVSKTLISKMREYKSLTLMHRFDSVESQIQHAKWIVENEYQNYSGMSIGVKEEDYDLAKKFIEIGIKIICIDIAHADSKLAIDLTKKISSAFTEVLLIAGNVATGDGARNLWLAGADVVKAGIGGSGICSTRLETGNGVPMLTCVKDCYEAKLKLQSLDKFNREIFLISDGGLKSAGDFSKSLCFADMSMAGNMFAGLDESPGELIELDGKKYKRYDGSSTYKERHVEGVKALTEYKGSLQQIIERLSDGISSCCSYQGVRNLNELKEVAEFTEMTSAGLRETQIHDVKIINN